MPISGTLQGELITLVRALTKLVNATTLLVDRKGRGII